VRLNHLIKSPKAASAETQKTGAAGQETYKSIAEVRLDMIKKPPKATLFLMPYWLDQEQQKLVKKKAIG